MVFNFKEHEDHHNRYVNGEEVKTHDGHLSHDLIAGAAVFEGIKAWNKHKEEQGEPPSHDKAKEIFGGAAAALVTHAFETKGLDKIQEAQLRQRAQEDAEAAASAYQGE